MSKPENILNDFRTYSYHHILIACDGTQTAELLTNQTEITQLQHPVSTPKYSRRSVAGHPNHHYVVIIDSLVDANLTIKSARWQSIFAPDTTMKNHAFFTSTEMEGELAIYEVQGIRFLQTLTNVCDELGTDPTGIVFMLKTIFVGHHFSGSTQQLTTVKPFLFTLLDVKSKIDTTGSLYQLSMIGVSNGTGKLPHASNVMDGFDFGITPGSTLKSVMKELEFEIKEHYQVVKSRLKEQVVDCAGITEFDIDNYREVEYRIELDPEYQGDHFTAGSNEPTQKQSKGNGDPIISGDVISIDALLDKIMMTSPEVISEQTKSSAQYPGEKYTHKITSTLDTGPDHYRIVYHIRRYKHTFSPVKEGDMFAFKPPEGEGGIEFDYIFTGKNTDIQDLNIQMEYGMAFLQTITSTNNLPSSLEVADQTTNNSTILINETDRARASETGKPRPKTPLFPGTTARSIINRNKNYAIDTLTYNSMLARHAAIENVELKFTINGNPQLLGELNVLPSDLSPISNPDTPVTEGDSRITRNLYKYPGYVKVNIMMPESESQDYAEPFWYQGWYYIYSVDNVFEQGKFTQELSVFSIPTDEGQILKTADCSTDKQTQREKVKPGEPATPSSKVKSGEYNIPKDKQKQTDKTVGQVATERQTNSARNSSIDRPVFTGLIRREQ